MMFAIPSAASQNSMNEPTLTKTPILPAKDFPLAMDALYCEAGLKLQRANEILSHAHLMPGSFNSVEVRLALQEAAEAVATLTHLDVLISGKKT